MTYTPGLNGGRINATISGNTAGVGALISTGSMTLAGGNNITLSQNGNAITISGGAGGAGGTNTLGISNLGNSVGTSGVITGTALQYALAGGNNVTLSQSINGSSGTVTISAANQTVQTQNLHNLTLGGNSTSAGAGYAQISSGTMTLAGGNNITLSQNGNAVTVSGANQSIQTQNLVGDVNILGNTTGTTADISSGTMYLAGGSNVTLQQNNNSLSIHAAQSVFMPAAGNTTGTTGIGRLGFAIQGGNNITLSGSNFISYQSVTISGPDMMRVGISTGGNTAGTSGTVSNQLILAGGNNITLSQSTGTGGNTITISAPNLAGGAGFTAGVSNIGNTSGNTGVVTNQLVLAGGNNITLSQSTDAAGATVSISAGAGGANTLDYYQNMDRGTSASLATANRTLMLQRLNQENDVFAGNITANTFLVNMTANMTATSLSSSHSVSASIGIYLDQTTQLSLINSASTSWGFTAATDNTKYYHGPRWLSFVTSQWSSSPVFSAGQDYVFGIIFNSSNYGPPLSYIGQNYMMSAQRSGTMGVSAATNTTLAQGNFWNAMYSATQSSLPGTIASNVVNRNNATAIFMPHIIINNRYAGTL